MRRKPYTGVTFQTWNNSKKCFRFTLILFFLNNAFYIIAFTWHACISRTPEISHPPKTTLSWVHMKIEWVIAPGAISTHHNNTRENCILNVQDGVQQKRCFISFLDTFSFWCCSLSIKWISSCILCVFTFGTCNFRHVGFHVPTVRKIII